MKFQAVMFDLDGTLLNTIDDLADAMNAGLAAVDLPARTIAECKRFVGDGVANFASRAMGAAGGDEQALAKVLAAYRDEYARCWDRKTRPYDGVAEMLDALAAAGVDMAVLSNKPDESTRQTVAGLLGRWSFAVVMGARPDRPIKPDPATALEVARLVGPSPAEWLYLGDTNTDMLTANAAGMFAVGALWGFRPADELLATGAKVVIDHPADLLKLL